MALRGTDNEKLEQLTKKTYKDQAIWFLNGFWDTKSSEAELLWNYVFKCKELDLELHEAGSGLDEMKAHVFLEFFHETQTVREMRESLRSTGAIGQNERPKLVPLTHWLLFKYKVDWRALINSPQGDNKEEILKAQRMLDEVSKALKESEEKASAAAQSALQARSAAAEAKKSEEASYARAEESKQREIEAQAAKKELEAALAEVKAQEDAYNNKTKDLERKTEEGGVVSKNKAKAELAQHLAEDPLPLRRAKITQEAAVKKAERAQQAAADAVVAAEKAAKQASADRAAAEQAAQRAEEAKQAAERAVEAARQRVAEAEAFLEEVKAKPGQAQGALWWLDRELHEARKFLPESKGGIRK